MEFEEGKWYSYDRPWVWYSPAEHSLVLHVEDSNSSMYVKLGPRQEQAVRDMLSRMVVAP